MKSAFKAEGVGGGACLWHFTRAFGKKSAFRAEGVGGAACPWHFTLAFGMERAVLSLDIFFEYNVEWLKSLTAGNEVCSMTIDWSQFVPSMSATFAGVVLALIGTRLYDKRKDSHDKNGLILEFQEELEKLCKDIDNTVGSKNIKFCLNPAKTPVWDSVINTKKLMLIRKYHWYQELMALYDDIKDYNEWHRLRTRQYYDKKDISELSTSLKGHGEEMKDKLCKLRQKMEGKSSAAINLIGVEHGA
jgi:hypothetical protein